MKPEIAATRKVHTDRIRAENYLYSLGFHHAHNIWIKPLDDKMAGVYVENRTQFVTYEWDKPNDGI